MLAQVLLQVAAAVTRPIGCMDFKVPMLVWCAELCRLLLLLLLLLMTNLDKNPDSIALTCM